MFIACPVPSNVNKVCVSQFCLFYPISEISCLCFLLPPYSRSNEFHVTPYTSSLFFFYFLSIIFFSFVFFYSSSSTVVSIFLPTTSPIPPIPAYPLWLFPCVLYTWSLMTLPLFFSPIITLHSPLWLLSACSLFQCLWLYFACLFVLLTSFYL